MLDAAARLIREYDLLPPGSKVLCALSGGADSVCLLHILSQRKDISLSAAHYNHQLRGDESDQDEVFVRELCRQWDIPCHVGCGDVAATAKARKQGIEETARQMRYAFLFETAEKLGGAAIATAHNADDNAETVLLNLIRGTGLRGLTGISPKREGLIRPLLHVSRAEILAYLEENDLPHREDSTNADENYTRNKLRAQVMPLLRELNPRAVEHFAATAAQLTEIDRYLDGQAKDLLSQVGEEPGRVSLPMEALLTAPTVLRGRMVFQLLDRLGVGRKDVRALHVEAVLSLTHGGSVDLPHGVTARREYDTLILTTENDPPPLWEPFTPREGETPVPGTSWTVILEGPPWPGLVVRARQTGDAITLPGRKNRSLKKLFIDRKIPQRERDTLPVVADANGVLFVAGLGPNTDHPRRGAVQIKHTEENET